MLTIGLTLDEERPSIIWNPDGGKKIHKHSLLVKRALLGQEVKKDEINVVEIKARGYAASDLQYPIVRLKEGTDFQSLLNLVFPDPPVTFMLIEGTGPIHLLGLHSAEKNEDYNEELCAEEESSQGEEEESIGKPKSDEGSSKQPTQDNFFRSLFE